MKDLGLNHRAKSWCKAVRDWEMEFVTKTFRNLSHSLCFLLVFFFPNLCFRSPSPNFNQNTLYFSFLNIFLSHSEQEQKSRVSNPFSTVKRKPIPPTVFLSIHRRQQPQLQIQTRTQMAELEQVFKKFDVNGDGSKISASELGSIMGSLGHPTTEEELEKMIVEVDADGDGFIDLNEFVELNTKGVDSDKAMENLKDAFSVYDMDGNWVISADELQKVTRSLGFFFFFFFFWVCVLGYEAVLLLVLF